MKTVGPWRVDRDGLSVIVDNDVVGGVLVFLPALKEYAATLPLSIDEMRANANVAAAAPDLLRVCELIVNEWEKETADVERGELIARLSQYASEARKTIAKARGFK